MAFFARDEYTAAAAQTMFTVTFPFLDSADIVVSVNGVDTTAFTVAGTAPTKVTLNTPSTVLDAVVLRRATPHSALVAFTGGVPVTQENMETQRKQFTYLLEEENDAFQVPVVDAAAIIAAAVKVEPICRVRFPTSTSLALVATGFSSNDASTIVPMDIIDNLRNSPVQFALPGDGSILIGQGLWSISVAGRLNRTDLTAGNVTVDWDLVDVIGSVRKNAAQAVIHMGPALGVVADDQQSISFQGHALIDSPGNANLKLRMARTVGTGAVEVVDLSATCVRYGA